MRYFCTEYKEQLPGGGSVHTSIGGENAVIVPKSAYWSKVPVFPPKAHVQVRKDNGVYPVWRAADGRVYLTWDDVGDAHLVDIRQYLEMVHRNENTGMTPLPYRTVKHELQKRGLDNR
jgi:hypothetical protein